MKKKTTRAYDQWEEWADTPYTSRNRDLNTFSYNNLNRALENYNNFTDAQKNQYQTVADQYTQSQWNDLNRAYVKQSNQLAQRNQQRLGAQGATSNLYNTDSLQRNYNDLASRIVSNTASKYQDLVNNEIANRLAKAQIYDTLFKQTGDLTNAIDYQNYQTRQTNKYNKWINDMASQRSWVDYLNNNIKGSIQGAAAGSAFGPWGALIGGAIGGTSALVDTYQNGADSSYAQQNPFQTGGGLGSLTNLFGNNNSQINLNPYSSSTMGGLQGSLTNTGSLNTKVQAPKWKGFGG